MGTDRITSGMCEFYCEDGIAVITLVNGKYNKLTQPGFLVLGELKVWLDKVNPYALIITGAGRNFSTGADIDGFGTETDDGELATKLEQGKKILDYISNLPLITVAYIHGACYGGGLEVALSCQFRVAAEGSFFAFPESGLGLLPGMGGTYRLKNVIGTSKAIQMILSHEIMDTNQAIGIGLVDKIVSKKCGLQECHEFIKSIIGENLSREHVKDIIGTIYSNSQEQETDMFIKYLREYRENSK